MKDKILGIVFSNIHDQSLSKATQNRTFAAMPFMANYRLVDFSLSNLSTLRPEAVGVITKYNYRSLVSHISDGAEWDLKRKNGGVLIISPFEKEKNKIYKNRLEALFNAREFIAESSAQTVVLCDCNLVSIIDLNKAFCFHLEKDADITLLTSKQTIKADFSVSTYENGEIYNFSGDNFYLDVFFIKRELVLKIIDYSIKNNLKSFSEDILKKAADKLKIFAFDVKEKIYKIASLNDYYSVSFAILKSDEQIFNNLITRKTDLMPTVYKQNSKLKNSVIGENCIIDGYVENSIIFSGVKIECGCKVVNSIIMNNCIITNDSELSFVIADKNLRFDRKKLKGNINNPLYLNSI